MNNRRRQILIGLAIGDARGAAVEFKYSSSFAPVLSFRSRGPHSPVARVSTDETSMALALADNITTAGWTLNDITD